MVVRCSHYRVSMSCWRSRVQLQYDGGWVSVPKGTCGESMPRMASDTLKQHKRARAVVGIVEKDGAVWKACVKAGGVGVRQAEGEGDLPDFWVCAVGPNDGRGQRKCQRETRRKHEGRGKRAGWIAR